MYVDNMYARAFPKGILSYRSNVIKLYEALCISNRNNSGKLYPNNYLTNK